MTKELIIIDDDKDVEQLYLLFLKKHFTEVPPHSFLQSCGEVKDFFENNREGKYIILADYCLPQCTAIDIFHEIDKLGIDYISILSSGLSIEDINLEGKKVDHMMPKPVDMSKLMLLIKEILQLENT